MPTDPTANLPWPQKIRLLQRRFEHSCRNLLLNFSQVIFTKTLSSKSNPSLFKALAARSSIKRILIIRTGKAMGDAIMSLVLIPECQRLFPNATIDLLLRDNISSLFKETAGVDTVLEFHPRFLKWPVTTGRLFSKLRTKGYDLAIACDNPYKSSFTTLCLCLWTGAPWQLGFENEESRSFLNLMVSAQKEEKMVTNLKKLLIPFGESPKETEDATIPKLSIPTRYLTEADMLLGSNSKPILVFISNHWRKSWPLDSF